MPRLLHVQNGSQDSVGLLQLWHGDGDRAEAANLVFWRNRTTRPDMGFPLVQCFFTAYARIHSVWSLSIHRLTILLYFE